MAEGDIETDVEEVVPPEVDPEEQAYEDKARRMGWRPKDEYKGNQDRWVDARTFVMRGEAELPILRERFRKLDERLASTDNKLKDTEKKLTEASEVLVELRDMSRGAEERAYKRAVDELRAKQREAVREASEAKFEEAQREIDALPRPVPPKKAPETVVPPKDGTTAPPLNPVYTQWISENSWFNSDRVLNAVAIAEEQSVQQEFPGMSLSDQLAEVKNRVMDRFPEKFGVKRPTRPNAVATTSAPPTKSKGKTVKDLPADARAALAKFKSQIPGYKDEDYLALYFQGEE